MRINPPSLSHFVIFNPTLKPSPASQSSRDTAHHEERDKDLEDDLKEAAQILFYTSRSSRTVSRDTMLKQTGLVKGLMGFTDMVIPSSGSTSQSLEPTTVDWMSVKTSKSRLVIYTPEKDVYVYINVTLATSVSEDGKAEPAYSAQGMSDLDLMTALRAGYADFRVRRRDLGGSVDGWA
jgi:hypothetical protein